MSATRESFGGSTASAKAFDPPSKPWRVRRPIKMSGFVRFSCHLSLPGNAGFRRFFAIRVAWFALQRCHSSSWMSAWNSFWSALIGESVAALQQLNQRAGQLGIPHPSGNACLMPIAAAPAPGLAQVSTFKTQPPAVGVPISDHQLVRQAFGVSQDQPLIGKPGQSRRESVDLGAVHGSAVRPAISIWIITWQESRRNDMGVQRERSGSKSRQGVWWCARCDGHTPERCAVVGCTVRGICDSDSCDSCDT